MILAAGEGRRMRPLTDHTPKPLLPVAGKTLIEHQLARLVAAGVEHCVINIAYLGEQIRQRLGDGTACGLQISYSPEPYPLETGGAINHALPLLGEAPFLLVNADIWLDYPLTELIAKADKIQDGHLVLVDNPDHNQTGDFMLDENSRVRLANSGSPAVGKSYTFSGLSLLRPQLIRAYPHRREIFPLREAFAYSAAQGGLSGETFHGTWMDIGTPERLQQLAHYLRTTGD